MLELTDFEFRSQLCTKLILQQKEGYLSKFFVRHFSGENVRMKETWGGVYKVEKRLLIGRRKSDQKNWPIKN